MSWGWLSCRGRVLSGAGLGVLSWAVPAELVDEAVGDGLAWEMRLRALPSRLGVYFVLGLCLFSHLPYGQVLREVTAGLEGPLGAAGWRVPASTALTGVRRRVGEKPLASLFGRLRGPLSPGRAPWSHVCGLLAVAWDGTTVDACDSPGNAAAFGRPAFGAKGGGAGGDGPWPQLRMVVLAACGTRALLDAAFGPARGNGTGERELARQLLRSVRAGMLLLADRGFYSYALWTEAAAAGADLLWRVSGSTLLPVLAELPDGSWLAHVNDPRAVQARHTKNGLRRRRGSRLPPDASPLPGITVRVIEFTLTVTTGDGAQRTERYRLMTTLADWRACPAAELAAGYSRRRAIETGFREFKTYLHGSRQLRGRTPDLARQELWACLCVYQAVRALIARTAAGAGLDPGRISFTAALHAARRTMITARAGLSAALDAAEAEILSCLVPEPRARACPRAVKKPGSKFPSRKTRNSPASQHASYTTAITTPSPRTTTDQHEQPGNQQNQPP
jgi:hypothetical protein